MSSGWLLTNSVLIRADHLAAVDRPEPTQVTELIEFFMKWTEPSPKSVLTPPGCRLREPRTRSPRSRCSCSPVAGPVGCRTAKQRRGSAGLVPAAGRRS